MSVPGLIGSQYRALPAAVEKRGSTTTTCAPRESASAKSCTCVLCMFSPRCEPMRVITREFERSRFSGDPTGEPNVSWNPTSRAPRHCAYEGAAMLFDPYAVISVLKNEPP